jgi:hypothetical protein
LSSQADTENADLTREREELATQPEAELEELAGILRAARASHPTSRYSGPAAQREGRARAHAREELGIHELTRAKPFQAR